MNERKKERKKKNSKNHLDHLDISGLDEQAGELGAVDVEGKVPDEELQIGREVGLLFVLLVLGRDRYISDEKGGGFLGEKRK